MLWQVHNVLKSRPVDLLGRLNVYPMNIEQMALGLGVTLWDYKHQLELGMVKYTGTGAPQIWVNVQMSQRLQRFTIAHQLAHVILHMRIGEARPLMRGTRCPSCVDEVMAKEADHFASHLLMPDIPLSYYHQMYLGDTHLLAGRFDVSEAVADARLREFVSRQYPSLQRFLTDA